MTTDGVADCAFVDEHEEPVCTCQPPDADIDRPAMVPLNVSDPESSIDTTSGPTREVPE